MSQDRFSLSVSVTVNEEISEVIVTASDDTILVAYQINTRYNTYASNGTFRRINYGLHFVKSTPINDSLKEAV